MVGRACCSETSRSVAAVESNRGQIRSRQRSAGINTASETVVARPHV